MNQGGCFVLNPPFCKIYNSVPFCVKLCAVHIYYVVHKQENLIWVAIHLCTHDHLVAEGHFKEVVDQVKSLVEEEVFYTMGVPRRP